MTERHGQIPIRCRAVAVAIIAGKGDHARILLLRRFGSSAEGAWSVVTGSIEPGESAPVAARREVAEETGITVDRLMSSGLTETFFFAPDGVMELMPIFVTLLPAEVPIVLDHGSDDHRWCSLKEALDIMAFAGQRRAIADIWHDFVHREPADFRLVP
jgi:dihydroneopterin triphosphate diphosphatase